MTAHEGREPQRTAKAYGFANKERKNTKHHLRHAREMGYKNQDEYERAAVEFFNGNSGKLYYNPKDNRYYRYDDKTRRIAVCDAVEPSGNIISVCKNQSEDIRGRVLLKKAVESGGDRLDAFGEDLYGFYTRNGFEPVSYTPFNEEYAPEGWQKGREKPEPVIFYKYTGEKTSLSYDEFLSKTKPSAGYDVAKEIRDKEIKK